MGGFAIAANPKRALPSGPCRRARAVFQLSRDREPAERNVVSALTGALFTHLYENFD